MIRKILLLAVACVFAFGASAAENVTEFEVLKGEKWWGLNWDGLVKQPMAGSFYNTMNTGKKQYNLKPIMVSSAGRYVYSDKPIKIYFDSSKFTITSEFEKVEVQKGGKTLREAVVVCALNNLNPGASPNPEMFALPIYETVYEFGYALGEEEIVGYAEKLIGEGFPAGIIVVADGWQKVSGPYEFDPDIYPDPKRMVDRLHALGFKVMLTVSPIVPKWGRVYGEAKRDDQLLGTFSSELDVLDLGSEAQFMRVKTGLDKIKAKCGFDGYRFEFGVNFESSNEHTQNIMSLSEGYDMVQYKRDMDRSYPPYMSSIYVNKKNRFSSIGNIITAGLMGYPYIQTEFNSRGYFSHEWQDDFLVAAPEDMSEEMLEDFLDEAKLDSRNMADYLLLQCGMPVATVDFAPWRITDPKLYEGVKKALNFRVSMGDYMRKLVLDSRRTGEPLARHMEYQFPKSGFADCTDQFMLGTKYLFAPCVDGVDKRLVRFPKGTWMGQDGEKIKGPVVKQVDCSAGGLICFEAVK